MVLKAKALGLAGGLVVGLLLMILTVVGMLTGYGVAYLDLIGSLMPVFSVSLSGAVVALIFGFLKGYIIFYLIAEFYNRVDV